MIAHRFRAVSSAAGVAGAALVFYLVSQWVAAERTALVRVDREIASTRREISLLSMEIGARSRMSQLERWNGMVWRLSAPKPRQFLGSEVQLATFNQPVRPPVERALQAAQSPVTTVAYAPPAVPGSAAPIVAAAAMVPPAPQPLLRQATFVREKPVRLALSTVSATALAPVSRPISLLPASKPASLLPDDIGRLAATEAGRAKRGGRE